MRTAFEIVGSQLGAQNTIVGGGRYDGLSEMIGGPQTRGFGFAFGIERMVMSIPDARVEPGRGAPHLFIAYIGAEARGHAFNLTRRLREAGASVVVDLESRKLKKALAVANNLGVRRSLIIGEDEIKSGDYQLRDMKTGEQVRLSEAELLEMLKQK
jgi:histidyl-tRNA synthetase